MDDHACAYPNQRSWLRAMGATLCALGLYLVFGLSFRIPEKGWTLETALLVAMSFYWVLAGFFVWATRPTKWRIRHACMATSMLVFGLSGLIIRPLTSVLGLNMVEHHQALAGLAIAALFFLFSSRVLMRAIPGGEEPEASNGFFYWSVRETSGLVKAYWIVFSLIYIAGLSLAIVRYSPFLFLLIAAIPCALMVVFRGRNNPVGGLEESIRKSDTRLYQEIFEAISQRKITKQWARNVHFLTEILRKGETEDWQPAVAAFKRNYGRVWSATQASFFIWGVTFMLLMIICPILYGRSQ